MTIAGKMFTDRKEAGTALMAACAGLKAVNTVGQVGDYQGFTLSASFDSFRQAYLLTLKRQCSYTIEISKDAFGNIQRINNALGSIETQLIDAERKLENLQKQLAVAQEEVKKPFAHEDELTEKLARLTELNAMLNMDEHDSADTLGVDEEIDEEVADCTTQETTYASQEVSRASDAPVNKATYGERVSNDADKKPSLLERLRSKQAIVNEQKAHSTLDNRHEQSR